VQVKICDFGLAKHAATAMTASYIPTTTAFTREYTSPQRIINYIRTFEDDVYAFGILMFFIATSDAPYDHIEKGAAPPSSTPARAPPVTCWWWRRWRNPVRVAPWPAFHRAFQSCIPGRVSPPYQSLAMGAVTLLRR
jgi:serine/threonine protein kinase